MRIKHYDLYGENKTSKSSSSSTEAWTNSFHFERIPQRSSHFNWEIEPHVHDSFLQILHLTKGQADVTINGTRLQVASPSLIIIPAQNVHSFQFSKNTDGPVITVSEQALRVLAQTLMPELRESLAKPSVIRLGENSATDAGLSTLLTAIEHEWRVHSYGHDAASLGLLSTLLIHVTRYASQNIALAPRSRQSMMVDKFKVLVNDKFKSQFSMDEYAQRLGVSAGQLTRICKQNLGLTALEVINARIVFEAQRELTYTADSIKQIAANLGFEDEAYFSRFFKKQTQLSPLAFRQSYVAR
jgi:AraC family transcriptional activator of pobA